MPGFLQVLFVVGIRTAKSLAIAARTCIATAVIATGLAGPAAAQVEIGKFFADASIPLGGTTVLTFNIGNVGPAFIALTGIAFTDTLPAGLVVATPNGLSGSCGGGTITAIAGSGSISLSGASAPGGAPANCTFTVNVTATSAGLKTNIVTVTSDQGSTPPGNTATDPITVNQAATTTSLAASASSNAFGQPVTFTATVTSTVGTPKPTGTVTFKDGATTLGTGTLNASGQATFTITTLAVGSHSITATYGGDANFTASTSPPLTQTVQPLGTIILKVIAGQGDGTFAFSSPTPALSFALTTSGGSAQSAPAALPAGIYSIALGLPSGFGLVSGSCSDGDSVVDIASKTATINLGVGETVTCTFTTANSRAKTVAAIRRFLGLRNDLLLSNDANSARQIDRLLGAQSGNGGPGAGFVAQSSHAGAFVSSRLAGSFDAPESVGGKTGRAERLFGPAFDIGGGNAALPGGGAAPFSLLGQEEGATRLSFSTSFSQIMRAAAQAEASRQSQDLGLETAPSLLRRHPASAWDFWMEGRYVSIGDDRNGASLDASFGVLYLGADYVVSPALLIGALVQFDSLRQKSQALATDVDGWGWMAGPYATVRLSQHLFLQGRAAWGGSDNAISPFMTYEDRFTSDRWLVSSTLTGRWQFGPWLLRPSASVAYIEDVSKAYVDALGVTIPAVKATLGQARFGPEIAYRYLLSSGGSLEPRVALQGIWSFAGNATEVVAGTPAGPEELRGRVEIGLQAMTPSGLILDLSGSYDGIGVGNYEAISGKASVRVPLN
jgi:hypothetical protein